MSHPSKENDNKSDFSTIPAIKYKKFGREKANNEIKFSGNIFLFILMIVFFSIDQIILGYITLGLFLILMVISMVRKQKSMNTKSPKK